VLVPIGLAARATTKREGVERDVLLRATSFAFFATIFVAAAYGLLEAFADAPRISMWVPWMVGGATWSVTAVVLSRRLA
jgi:hypothetical protein